MEDHPSNEIRSRRHQETRKKAFRPKKIFTFFAIVFASLAMLVGLFAGVSLANINQLFDEINPDATAPETLGSSQLDEMIKDKEPISVLLVGTDLDENDQGRTDTIIVATINPKEESVKLVSIPRDTLITLPGTDGTLDKINAAHSYSGIGYTIDAVEEFLEIPIHFYAKVDFMGLVELVDAIGGVEVDSPFAFSERNGAQNPSSYKVYIEEGKQKLDGEQALGYARMRKQDPDGDFGRQRRQRELIENLVKKLSSMNTLVNFNKILEVVRDNVQTNMTNAQMWAIASQYASAAEQIDSLEIDGLASSLYLPHYGQEVYVWQPLEESLNQVRHELQAHLELTVGEVEEIQKRKPAQPDSIVEGQPVEEIPQDFEENPPQTIPDTVPDTSFQRSQDRNFQQPDQGNSAEQTPSPTTDQEVPQEVPLENPPTDDSPPEQPPAPVEEAPPPAVEGESLEASPDSAS